MGTHILCQFKTSGIPATGQKWSRTVENIEKSGIVMQKKFKKSHKQKIKCYGFDCEIFQNARKIFPFCVVVLAHLYCSQVLETQLDVSEIQF